MMLSFNSASFSSVAFILTYFNATELSVDLLSEDCWDWLPTSLQLLHTKSLLPIPIALHRGRVLWITAGGCSHASESSSASHWHPHQVIDWCWGFPVGWHVLNVSAILFSILKPVLKMLESLAQQNLRRLVLATQQIWKLWRSYGIVCSKSDWQQSSTGEGTSEGTH